MIKIPNLNQNNSYSIPENPHTSEIKEDLRSLKSMNEVKNIQNDVCEQLNKFYFDMLNIMPIGMVLLNDRQ